MPKHSINAPGISQAKAVSHSIPSSMQDVLVGQDALFVSIFVKKLCQRHLVTSVLSNSFP